MIYSEIIDSFYKKITFQQLAPNGLLALAPTVETMAEAEGLHAHAQAVVLRREALAPSSPTSPA